MNLTKEQLEQRRWEFEKLYSKSPWVLEEDGNGSYKKQSHHFAWQGFQAAWRPVPTVKEIDEIIRIGDEVPNERGEYMERIDIARNIHRAFGGKDE